jgi:hypothetical protein
MAHVAKIENSIVTQVIVVSNDVVDPENFATELLGGTWIQTSYNGKIRFNFAGISYSYDEVRDAFIAPQCHAEAVLDEAVCLWVCDNGEHDAPIR